MKNLPFLFPLLLFLSLPCVSAPMRDQIESGTMTYIYNAPESSIDVRYDYQWEILRTALERTKDKYGPFSMVKSRVMSEKRQARQLINGSGDLTVMYLGTKPRFERDLIGIHIPVDKDLGGYCVLLVNRNRIDEFRNIDTLENLRRFSIGLGNGWLDVEILRQNGFRVVTGTSYNGLFEMLVYNRFDIFLRSVVEVLDEVEQRKELIPNLYIEETICLFYPMPMYFWFQKNSEGQHLASRAEEGMRAMIEDGTYDEIFNRYQQPKIERLKLGERKILRIENPWLGPETPFQDKRLWFDPETYHVTGTGH